MSDNRSSLCFEITVETPLKKRSRTPSSTPRSTTTASNQTSPVVTSQELFVKGTGVPHNIIKNAKRDKEGTTVDQRDGITVITFHNLESQSFLAFQDWKASLTDAEDPLLSIVPLPGMANEAAEAWCIVHHFATLRASDFQPPTGVPYPQLPHPNGGFPRGIPRFHHAAMALSKVKDRVSNPRDPNYATIGAHATGTHLCDLMITWGKGHVTVEPILRQ